MKKEIKVRFGAETKGLNKGFDDAQKKVGNFSSSVKKAAIGLGAAFGAAAVLSGIKSMVNELTNAADRLLDLEQITGLSTDRLQEYEHVARVAGVNSETLANAVQGLTRRLAGATTESSPLNLALKQLGIVSRDTNGQLRNGGAIMEEAIAKLAAMENITERNVLGAQMFGGAWKDIAPILALGADGMAKAQEEARRLGLVMSKDTLIAANDLRIEMETLNAQWLAGKRDITIAILPALKTLSGAFSTLASIIRSDAMPWYQKFWAFVTGNAIDIIDADNQKRWLDGLSEVDKLGIDIINKQKEINNLYEKGYKEHHKPIVEATRELNELQDKYNKLLAEEITLKKESTSVSDEIISKSRTVADIEQEIKDAQESYRQAQNQHQQAYWTTQIANLQKELALVNAIAGAMAKARPIEQAQVSQDPYPAMMERRTSAASEHFNAVAQMSKHQGKLDEMQIDSMEQIGAGLANLAATGQASANQMIKALMAEATAALIKHIMLTVPFPTNIALAMGAGAMVGGLQSQIPAFKDGGMVKSPTLAMFGEYPGARTNPEYALRHDQLEKIAGGGNVRVVGKITGENIYLSNERFGRRTQLVE